MDYGALFSYSPYGTSEEEELSRSYRSAVKNDEPIRIAGREVPMPEFVAQTLKESRATLPFGRLFDSKPVLVPVTSSSLKNPDSLWVPFRIASAMQSRGLGSSVSVCLVRKCPVQRAATSISGKRPKAIEHYESQEVQKLIADPESILLVDDVVTSGATLVGSALRLAEAYPKTRIFGFAAMKLSQYPPQYHDACKVE